MTVVYVPNSGHQCGPNRRGFWLNHSFDLPGTVRECACGKSWIAYSDPLDPGYMGVKWRREGRLHRWRRVRAARITRDEPGVSGCAVGRVHRSRQDDIRCGNPACRELY